MSLSTNIVDEIISRDKHTCVYCSFKGDSFEKWLQLSIDHLIPKSQGGNDDFENLVTACNHCNSVTNRYKVSSEITSIDDITIQKKKIIIEKKNIVASHRKSVFQRWYDSVSKMEMT